MKRLTIFLLLITCSLVLAQPWMPSGAMSSGKGGDVPTPPEPPELQPTPGWQRPADWLPLPEIAGGEQKMVALFAVWPGIDNNIADIKVTCSTGYTVDWGDGNIVNYNNDVVGTNTYDYDSLPAKSYCSEGYKTAVVQVYPQGGGDITGIAFGNSIAGRNDGARCYYLDILIQCDELTSLSGIGAGADINARVSVRQLALRANKITDMTRLVSRCHSLTSIPELNTASATNMSSMFNGCHSLTSIPELNTASVANMNSMFNGCYSLTSIPELNTASVTSMGSMLYNCYSLSSIPELNTASVTSMGSMFYNCYSLSSIPELNTASATNMSSMFNGCYSLTSIPELNTASVANMSSMFNGCYSLTSIPELNTASATNMSSMFNGCYSLTSIPELNTVNVTNMDSMFSNCWSLALNKIHGTVKSFSVQSCNLSAEALNTLFTNLGVVANATITISGNPGSATCDESIATAKGWKVTK